MVTKYSRRPGTNLKPKNRQTFDMTTNKHEKQLITYARQLIWESSMSEPMRTLSEDRLSMEKNGISVVDYIICNQSQTLKIVYQTTTKLSLGLK